MLCNNLASLPPIPTALGYTLRELPSLYCIYVPLETRVNLHLSLPAVTISDDDGRVDESRDSLWSEQVRSDPATRQAGVYS